MVKQSEYDKVVNERDKLASLLQKEWRQNRVYDAVAEGQLDRIGIELTHRVVESYFDKPLSDATDVYYFTTTIEGREVTLWMCMNERGKGLEATLHQRERPPVWERVRPSLHFLVVQNGEEE